MDLEDFFRGCLMDQDRRGCPTSDRSLLSTIVTVVVALVLTAGFFVTMPGAAIAATLYVGSNGLDSPVCGRRQAPCRSISQALLLAQDGDRILVGPGRYSPTEEAAEP